MVVWNIWQSIVGITSAIWIPYFILYFFARLLNRPSLMRLITTWGLFGAGIGLIYVGEWQGDWALIAGEINSAIHRLDLGFIILSFLDLYNLFFIFMFLGTMLMWIGLYAEKKHWEKNKYERPFKLLGLILLLLGLFFAYKCYTLPASGIGLSTSPYLFIGFWLGEEVKVFWRDYFFASISTIIIGVFLSLLSVRPETPKI